MWRKASWKQDQFLTTFLEMVCVQLSHSFMSKAGRMRHPYLAKEDTEAREVKHLVSAGPQTLTWCPPTCCFWVLSLIALVGRGNIWGPENEDSSSSRELKCLKAPHQDPDEKAQVRNNSVLPSLGI